ncbi:hypothetical protein [Streptomyces sp. NPDC048111]|uniref:hypothetical protein n=1 Tax=Streptomyces sp. NPDC048111 TaxID=3365500 RepID=UPI0037240A73
MVDVVDADELLRRIRRARDWAKQREESLTLDDDTRSEPGKESRNTETARILRVVREVLDELVEPGKHTGGAD